MMWLDKLVRSRRALRVRVVVAWLILAGSLIGWPLSALWLAKDEPQFVLGLSWLAITLTAWDIVTTSEVHEEQEEHTEK